LRFWKRLHHRDAYVGLFPGQQQVFLAFLRGSVFLTVLALLPFPLMIFWLFRVRFNKTYKTRPSPIPAAVSLGP
jgi:hypothetical protein